MRYPKEGHYGGSYKENGAWKEHDEIVFLLFRSLRFGGRVGPRLAATGPDPIARADGCAVRSSAILSNPARRAIVFFDSSVSNSKTVL